MKFFGITNTKLVRVYDPEQRAKIEKVRIKDDVYCWDCNNVGLVVLDATEDRGELAVACPRCTLGEYRTTTNPSEAWFSQRNTPADTYNGGFTLNSHTCPACGQRMRREHMDQHDWAACRDRVRPNREFKVRTVNEAIGDAR